jgi:predicted nucleic acid-binding protein
MTTPSAPEADSRGDLFFDAVTLSNFALIGRLDILVARYGARGRVGPEVLDELLDGIAAGYDRLGDVETALDAGSLADAPPLSAEERRIYRELLRTLAPGEASCIARAISRGGVVVTDDRAARASAREHGVACTGTVGILKACCVDGTLRPSEADSILEAMVEGGYYGPVRRISDLL